MPNETVLDEGPKMKKGPKLSQRESENSLQLETGTNRSDRVKVHDDEFVMSGQHFNVKYDIKVRGATIL